MNPLKLIAIYARVSTAAQEEQQTIKTQLAVLSEYCQTHGYTISEQYTDEGWSGDTLIRPALDKLRNDARSKKWQAVLIYDPDRLARRYSYQELVMDELKEAGVEIIFITIAAPKNSEDKILHGVRGLFAEYERAKISERFRLGKLRKIKEGHILVTVPLYGYNYIPMYEKQHGHYTVNTQEAVVVKMIFSWVGNEGLTLRQVVRRLQTLDIRPRKSKRGVWCTSTLSTILRNTTYIGQAHWGSSYATVPINPLNKEKYRKNKKSSRRSKPKEEWYFVEVPSIIENELFERTRKQLEANYALCQRNVKNEYLLSRKIYCTCGSSRTGEGPKNGKYLYYRCSSRVRNFPLPATCLLNGIDARIADDMVWNTIVELMCSPELLRLQISRSLQEKQKVVHIACMDIKPIENEIKILKSEKDRYTKAYGAGIFTMDQLKEYSSVVTKKISELEIQLSAIEKVQNLPTNVELPREIQIDEYAQKCVTLLRGKLSFQFKRSVLLSAIDRIVGMPESLQVSGYLPIPFNINVNSNTNDRNSSSESRRQDLGIPFEISLKIPKKRCKNRLRRPHQL